MSDDPGNTDEDAAGGDASEKDTAGEGVPVHRRLKAPPEQWEAVGRKAMYHLLARVRDDFDREVGDTIVAVEHGGSVTTDHVSRLRESIESAELVVESMLVPLVDEAEPWESTADRVPYGRIAESLGVEFEELRELMAGGDEMS